MHDLKMDAFEFVRCDFFPPILWCCSKLKIPWVKGKFGKNPSFQEFVISVD